MIRNNYYVIYDASCGRYKIMAFKPTSFGFGHGLSISVAKAAAMKLDKERKERAKL